MSASASGTLTATGSVTLAVSPTDNQIQLQVSGTYTGVTLFMEGSRDVGVTYFGLAGVRTDNLVVQTTGTSGFTIVDGTTIAWDLFRLGLTNVRLRASAISGGNLVCGLTSLLAPASPPFVITSFGASIGQAGQVTTEAGLIASSTTNAITAHAGGTQALGVPLTTGINRVTVVGTGGDSVVLPASTPGVSVVVVNTAALSLNVFPAVGDQVNALGANAAFAVATTKVAAFFCTNAGQWHTILTA